MIMLLLVGIVFSQSANEPAFTLVQDIGLTSPQGVQYDPNFDRFVMVTTQGQLVLADVMTQDIQHILYTGGSYYGYQLSHDGHWLAVAQGNQVDIWDTQTGELDLELVPTVALGFSARLEFSDDDTLLLFKAFVPAPDEIRRSENDTTLTPWVWDLEAERRNRTGILPERRRAQPFFDLRTDLLLTPNNKLIAALPRSISVMDFSTGAYETLTNLETNRFEFDPIDVWYSMRGKQAYFRSTDGSLYHQINTQTGLAHPIHVGRELASAEIAQQEQLALSDSAQIIGEPNSRQSNSFARLLLTDRYHPNESTVTVMLLDILDPVTLGNEQTAFLVYLFNEDSGRGVIDVIRPSNVSQITLNPARSHVAIRRTSGDHPVEIYELSTGNLVTTFVPRYPDVSQNQVFEFNLEGDELLVGWARYDVHSGESLIETPRYHPGFQNFVFSADDRSIITMNENELWTWDISTGEPINRETIRLNGEFIISSPDSTRYLTRIPYEGEVIENGVVIPQEGDTEAEDETLFDAEDEDPDVVALLQEAVIPSLQIPAGRGLEIYNAITGNRRQVLFEQLPYRDIRQTILSPDWEHIIVVYDSNSYSPYYPGNEIAIYSMDEGLLWFYAGDDLPAPRYRRYGWSDNNTAFVLSGNSRSSSQPQRIYGLDYHPSGLPTCLVEAFPDEWTQWQDLWEQLNSRLRSDKLGFLTQELCASSLASVEAVDDIFFPSPTPTQPAIQATSSRIAGLPSCLSNAFGRQAADYAPQWRTLVDGLDDTQIAEVEEILCQGLREGINIPVPNVGYKQESRLQVVSIDVQTGERSLSGFAPLPIAEPRPLAPVMAEFRAQFGFEPADIRLSNNTQLLAIRTPNNHVRVYQLNRPYQTYIDNLSATRDASQANLPVSVSLLATSTAPSIPLGGSRPTLTPTITPTAPPRAEARVTYPDLNTVVELCEDVQLYNILAPPADYQASGQLLTNINNDSQIVVYNLSNGRTKIGYDLADASRGQLSSDQDWLLMMGSEIVVSKADGTNPIILYEDFEQSVFPYQINWIDNNTLELSYEGYMPDVEQDSVVLYRQYDVETGELSPPVTATPSIKVNDLTTSGFLQQPQNGSLIVLWVSFNAGYKNGYRYYLYDSVSKEISYFARVSDGSTLDIRWSPNGDTLFYRYTDSEEWYIYDSIAQEHRILGTLPEGQWSRDGRYRVQWFLPDQSEIDTRRANDQAIPKLRLWDSQTGLTRHYCIPETDATSYYDTSLFWSSDNRYLAFTIGLPADRSEDTIRQRTLILDTETGRVTELSRDVNRIIIWTE